MKKIIVLSVLLFCANCIAGSQTGKVQRILAREDGLLYVILDGVPTGKPQCATIGYWMIKDENSNYGKAQLSLLMMAFASGKTVTIEGRNTCSRWSDGEDISGIDVKNN
ncbi:MAG TPA: hypothetical protein VLF09_13895 [Cellvibrio sp.]|nr:hypothetical protein [Cellvibrio sp.]